MSRQYALLEKEELLQLKRILTMLHTEVHNPGYIRSINENVDIDASTEHVIYMLDHALENLRGEDA